MTTGLLAACIATGLLLQAGVFAAIWFRQWMSRPVAAEHSPVRSIDPELAWAGWREFGVAGRTYEDPAHTSCSFYLAPVDGKPLPSFKPGQFLTFSIPIDGHRALVRCYSLSEEPRTDRYRITVKRVAAPRGRPELPAGACSNWFHDRIQVGDILKVKAPNGRFTIDEAFAGPIVFVAGGIGITPLLCMLKSVLNGKPERSVYMFYGVRNAREHAFKAVLEDLASHHRSLRLVIAYSAPDADALPGKDYHHRGHVDIALLRKELPYGGAQFYVCGPPALMACMIPALRTWGVPDKDIRYEAFGPASAQESAETGGAAAASQPFQVRWSRSGQTLVWTGEDANLLSFAERHNIYVESGCRSGSCGSCETKVVSGTVLYSDEPDHPISPGYCLLCVGRPGSDLALEA
ncbi:2Fe-2S iron-sulfur cluster-binding protein [Dyella sp.]|uniref:2Fe-2S iron-sulfur cluster-binding protein n=1 Tax=Dyella sp. TaxID=1869338 RepID=UPI002D7734CB|nr:2Fe-2S iron-sulfur cluster-binding protein [Dyella sp.]HET7331085.1 2Fe-2S iron-sulfur cluster-binding protein [Dyella sp.]